MKIFLPILLIAILLASCSGNDDGGYPRLHDISFSVTSTDNHRLSNIEVKIMNIEEDVDFTSYNDEHLPLVKKFENQRIQEFTILEIGYRDNSGGAVGTTFDPYTVVLTIMLDTKVIAEKEFQVTESGHVDFVNHTFQ